MQASNRHEARHKRSGDDPIVLIDELPAAPEVP